MDKDLYEILGVSKTATETEIKKAFHRHAKKYHPDVNPGNKEAEQKFKELNLAYEVLKDVKKRKQYDQMRAAGANPFSRNAPPGSGGMGGMGGFSNADIFGEMGLGDLFEEIFGGGMRQAGGKRRSGRHGGPFQQRGPDHEVHLPVSFLDAAKGVEKTFEVDGRRLTVKIPEGITSGNKIKLSGQGGGGAGGGPSGDMIITLEVQSHPDFRREGDNLIYTLPISFSEAVLGAEIAVPTLDGKGTLKIPRGISSGQRLKLSGKGIRNAKTGGRGDQFVEVQIKVPKTPDSDYEQAAQLIKNSSFHPR